MGLNFNRFIPRTTTKRLPPNQLALTDRHGNRTHSLQITEGKLTPPRFLNLFLEKENDRISNILFKNFKMDLFQFFSITDAVRNMKPHLVTSHHNYAAAIEAEESKTSLSCLTGCMLWPTTKTEGGDCPYAPLHTLAVTERAKILDGRVRDILSKH